MMMMITSTRNTIQEFYKLKLIKLIKLNVIAFVKKETDEQSI